MLGDVLAFRGGEQIGGVWGRSFAVVVLALWGAIASAAADTTYARDELIADLRQLVDVVSSTIWARFA
jgi:hypothetical protein